MDNYIISKEDGTEIERVKYADLCDWWDWACEKTGIKLYVGQGMYRYSDKGNWSNSEEIINQLKYNHTKKQVKGTIFFTYKNFVRNDLAPLKEAQNQLKTLWTKDVLPF